MQNLRMAQVIFFGSQINQAHQEMRRFRYSPGPTRGRCRRYIVPGPGSFGAREYESAHVMFFCNQGQNCKCEAVASITINLFINLSRVTVLSIFWLLYKQAIQIITAAPGARGPGIGLWSPGKISLRGPGFACVSPSKSLHKFYTYVIFRCLRTGVTKNAYEDRRKIFPW